MRRRFLMMKAPTPADDPAIAVRMVVVLNWFDEVRRILSASATVGHARALARCDVDLVVAAALPLARKFGLSSTNTMARSSEACFQAAGVRMVSNLGSKVSRSNFLLGSPNNFQLSNPRREL